MASKFNMKTSRPAGGSFSGMKGKGKKMSMSPMANNAPYKTYKGAAPNSTSKLPTQAISRKK